MTHGPQANSGLQPRLVHEKRIGTSLAQPLPELARRGAGRAQKRSAEMALICKACRGGHVGEGMPGSDRPPSLVDAQFPYPLADCHAEMTAKLSRQAHAMHTDRAGDFPQGQLLIEAAAGDRRYLAEPCGCSLSGWFATRDVGDEFEDEGFHHDRRNVIGAAKLSAESMSRRGNDAAGEETRAIERCHGRSGAVGEFRADDDVEAA